jgi:hypothetical protein
MQVVMSIPRDDIKTWRESPISICGARYPLQDRRQGLDINDQISSDSHIHLNPYSVVYQSYRTSGVKLDFWTFVRQSRQEIDLGIHTFVMVPANCKIRHCVSSIPTSREPGIIAAEPTTVYAHRYLVIYKNVPSRQKVRPFVEEERVIPSAMIAGIDQKAADHLGVHPRPSRSISCFPQLCANAKFAL